MRISEARLRELAEIAQAMPIAIEVPLADGRRIGCVHAEVGIGLSWTEMVNALTSKADEVKGASEAAIWGRKRYVADARAIRMPRPKAQSAWRIVQTWHAMQPIPGIDRVYAGHSVLSPRVPRGRGNTLFLETGAYLDKGEMTLVDLAAEVYWQTGHWGDGVDGPLELASPAPPAEAWRPDDKTISRAQQQESFLPHGHRPEGEP